MEPTYNDYSHNKWLSHWQNGDLPWQEEFVHSDLLKYEDLLLSKPGRVFLPFCGKSVDMKYLAGKGHDVVGVEISKKAIQDFFKENSMSFSKTKHPEFPFEVYKADDHTITIYKGDMFEANKQMLGMFDASWDRGSFASTNVSDRSRYSKIVSSILKENGKILLAVYTYDGTVFGGPPYTIDEKQLQGIFSSSFRINLLGSYDHLVDYYKTKNLSKVVVSDYMLTRSNN